MYRLALGEHQEVIHYFIGLLKNKHLYQQTINILKKVVIYSNISDFLIRGLRSDFHGEVGLAKALRELGYNDEDVYLSLLEENYDEMYNNINYEEHLESEAEDINSIYSQIEVLFSELRNKPEKVVDTLLTDWLDYEDYGVNKYVARKLGEASSSYPIVELKLLENLHNKSSCWYSNIVLALGYLRNASQLTIDNLISLVQNHEDKIICLDAAKALIQLNIYHHFVLNQLLFIFKEPEPKKFDDFYEQDLNFNSQVFEALVQLGQTFDEVAPALAHWIEQNQDKDYAEQGIDALWMLIEGSTASQL